MAVFSPGMRILCRDAEWLVTRVDSASSQQDQVVHCVGADDLTRGHEAAFLTQLDRIDPVDPRKTKLVRDETGGYAQAKLFLEAQLRQIPLTDPDPHVEGMGAFRPMAYQIEAVQRAIMQLRPRLLLADAVGLGKTIEVGMILSELMKRGQADRILVLAKKSMLAQFQAESWNRFAIPLVRLDSTGLSKLQLKIPASKNPFEVYHRIIISTDTLKDIGRYSHFLEDTRWDVVVIDEAHNVSGGSTRRSISAIVWPAAWLGAPTACC
jgi:type I site-specific restriction endonuclease